MPIPEPSAGSKDCAKPRPFSQPRHRKTSTAIMACRNGLTIAFRCNIVVSSLLDTPVTSCLGMPVGSGIAVVVVACDWLKRGVDREQRVSGTAEVAVPFNEEEMLVLKAEREGRGCIWFFL